MSDIFRSSAHIHTSFCDGKNTPEEMVLRAIELGFVSLGFSGHGNSVYDPVCMSKENELLYRQEVLRLQDVYADRLEIILGIEHEAIAPYPDFPYAFMIESVHSILKDGKQYYIDYDFDHMVEAAEGCGDVYKYCEKYFQTCEKAYRDTPAQIAGHFDLVTKFNERHPVIDETDPRYLEPAMAALEAGVKKGLVFEINTGAIARGYRTTPYPAPVFLKRLKELGARVMVNSDCHDAAYLACSYEEARQYLLACGFDSVVRLRRHGLEEIQL
ncbi:MAG: histidinol-phosphatase HisJ family protein [Oscillospiraceae bacterium]|nr:histidinol-phosphatase HisJ family protein [Oscillospiraceae bacterium]